MEQSLRPERGAGAPSAPLWLRHWLVNEGNQLKITTSLESIYMYSQELMPDLFYCDTHTTSYTGASPEEVHVPQGHTDRRVCCTEKWSLCSQV